MSNELEPVRCGCGGEATVDCYLGGLDKNDLYYVYCPECNIQTANYLIEAEAVTAWNTAMGNGDGLSPEDRTAKVISVYKPIEGSDRTIYVTCCEKCERVVGAFDDYCPGCGCRLEWE